MPIYSPRNVIADFYDAVNDHDVDSRASEIFSDNVVLEGSGGVRAHGREEVANFFRAWWEAFPDARAEAAEIVVSGNTVVTQGTFTGTHRGVLRAEGLDLAPTEARIAVEHAHAFQLRNGRISEVRYYMDRLELQDQLRSAA